MLNIFISYIHYLGIMVLMGTLLSEHILFRRKMKPDRVKNLVMVDTAFVISAVIVLISGLFRWLIFGKYDHLMSNPVFHIKLSLFIILAALSVYPTLKFIKWRKYSRKGKFSGPENKTYKLVLLFLRIELAIIIIIPLLAVMMTKGFGL